MEQFFLLTHVIHCTCPLFPTPKAINRGIDAVRKIVEEKQLTGVYGPLIENFTCEPKVFTAIEVTAGNRYVHTKGCLKQFNQWITYP